MKRKQNLWILSLVLIGMFFFLQYGCKKESSSSSTTSNSNGGPDVTDIDGNVYHSVVIGKQTWMSSNLKTTHYRNGVAIPNVSDSTQWANDTTAAYCNSYNSTDSANIYGRLYNWYAAASANNLAPTGWHVASDSEWTVLTTYLGNNSGGQLKITGTRYWNYPNTSATNSTGFSALGAGDRSNVSVFHQLGIYGFWWTSSQSGGYGIDRIITNTSGGVYSIDYPKNIGFSVRCVKD